MGQYWMPVNLDKKEFINPHKLASGLKLWEQLASSPGTGAALVILCAAMPRRRGGGDFDLEENWHGPERTFPEHDTTPGPMPDAYAEIAARTIGRWAGDRIALVGDYAEDSDLSPKFKASKIYERCLAETKVVYNGIVKGSAYQMGYGPHEGQYAHFVEVKPAEYTDISDDVCRVIEHELNGKFEGDGWRDFKREKQSA